jgi:hypothetical protein
MILSLLLELTSGGGGPPANSTLMEIHREGKIVLLVGNALAEGEPKDEAGRYEMTSPTSEIKSIEDFIFANHIFDFREKYNPIHADSGFNVLYLYANDKEKKIKWGPSVKVPQPIRELEIRLSELRQTVRRHPVQVIGTTLGVVEQVTVGNKFHVEFSIKNRGSEAVQVLMPTESNTKPSIFKLYAASNEETLASASVLFDHYYQSQYISNVGFDDPSVNKGSINLPSGEETKMRASAPLILDAPGSYNLYGFVEPVLVVMSKGKPISVDCFFATRPITVHVH